MPLRTATTRSATSARGHRRRRRAPQRTLRPMPPQFPRLRPRKAHQRPRSRPNSPTPARCTGCTALTPPPTASSRSRIRDPLASSSWARAAAKFSRCGCHDRLLTPSAPTPQAPASPTPSLCTTRPNSTLWSLQWTARCAGACTRPAAAWSPSAPPSQLRPESQSGPYVSFADANRVLYSLAFPTVEAADAFRLCVPAGLFLSPRAIRGLTYVPPSRRSATAAVRCHAKAHGAGEEATSVEVVSLSGGSTSAGDEAGVPLTAGCVLQMFRAKPPRPVSSGDTESSPPHPRVGPGPPPQWRQRCGTSLRAPTRYRRTFLQHQRC